MLKKLRIKFICVLMTLVTAMLCLLLGLVVSFMGKGLEHRSVQIMQSFAAEHPGMRPPSRQKPTGSDMVLVRMDPRGVVVDMEGSLFEAMDPGVAEQIIETAWHDDAQTGVMETYSLRFCKVRQPMGSTIVFADTQMEQAVMANLVNSCIGVGCLCVLLFLGLSILLVRWMVRPVEQAWQQQRQFVADASHELKTPLTVIMTNAELLREQSRPAPEQGRLTDSILTMSGQMRGLVEALLELARADNGGVKTDFAQLDFSELISDGVLPFEPLFFERGLELRYSVEPGIALRGSRRYLQQLLEILLDNAMKYSFGGDLVVVALRRHAKYGVLSVASPGQPLSRKEQRDIFKRFYRVDKTRSRDGSYGLGLSIAQQIVREHRGRIWVESRDGINVFYVQLPLNG